MNFSHRTNALAVMALALAVAGCTVGPDYKRPDVAVPGQFAAVPATQPAGENALSSWWMTFNDPQLQGLIDRAVAGNLDLKIAAARVREARALRGVTASDAFPQVDVGGSYNRSRSSQNSFGGTSGGNTPTSTGGFGNSERSLWQAGFDASWELDIWGGVRRGVEAADADIAATIDRRNDIMVALLAEVARNYIECRGFQQQTRIAQENANLQRDTLGLIRARAAAGLFSTDLDVARAEAQVASTESFIPTFQTQSRAAAHRLGILLGLSPDALLAELEAESPIPSGAGAVPVGLPSDLILRRPDVRQAERQLAAATARIGQAKADYFPRFTLTGALGTQANKFARMADASSIFYSFGPGVSWPIFDANRIKFNVEVQNQRQQAALDNYKQQILISLEDVENSLVAFNNEQIRQKSLEEAVRANRRAVELSQQLFKSSLITFLDVLEVQRNLVLSEDQLAASKRIVSTNLVSVYKALGGGWDREPEVPPSEAPKTNVGLGP